MPPQTKYDVFVSFRGEIRNGFLSHLIDAFQRNQINAFVDDRLERGNEVWPSLVEAIQGSSISLIIFSKNYASSRWCLEELVTILKCRNEYGQIVIPVFYKVKPTHVGHQSSESYKNAFLKHQRKIETNVPTWRDALEKTAKISGIESSNWKNDAELVKEIVRLVLQNKPVKPAVNSKVLVGIDKKIASLESLIREEPTVTRVIGIWGMGGLGKTTLAEQVFNKLRHEYGGSYFLLNERDQSSKRDLISLKKEIFSQLLGRDINIDLPNSLPTDVLPGIGCIKVLIVLDDVNDSRDIRKLLGNLKDFGLGSRTIITTRDKNVLKNEADVIYELPVLNSNEAFELFNLKAFKRLDDQRDEYNMLLERVVRYAQGIPLVLEVLAGRLCGNPKEEWEGELDKLEKMPHGEVYDVMIWSYKNLDREQKQSFLDIACFFLRSHHVISLGDLQFLLKDDESGNSVYSNLKTLKQKALLTFSKDNVVSMHDVLQETALEIVRRKFKKRPESCRWFWDPVHVYEALENDKVGEAIRSLQIPLKKMEEQKLIPHIFAKMSRLRFLEIFEDDLFNQRHTLDILAECLQYLSTEIRFLNFKFYPLKSLPEHFSTEKLVVLKLQENRMEKLWVNVKNLVNLKTLDLCWSEMLKELPDLSKAINLEVLLLCGCSMLTNVHPSIFSLPKLEKLDLSRCSSLTKLASDSHLCKLNYLNLSKCRNLTKFLVISENMKELRLDGTKVKALPSLLFEHQSKLEFLNLWGTDIEKIPSFDNNLMQQLRVDISGCKRLQTLPEHLPYDETLDVSGCSSLETLPKLHPSLETLNTKYCTSLQTLPKLPPSLKTLIAYNCKLLKTLPELPPAIETLDVQFCSSLETLPKLPPSLKTLNTKYCTSLQTLPKLAPSLKTLKASYCKSLRILPELPMSLKTLIADGCKLLKTLPELPPTVETLDVWSCYSLETLPKLPPSLKTINAQSCNLLKTLPELPPSIETLYVNLCRGIVTLPELSTSLQTLDVSCCWAIETLPELPPSLKTLKVCHCNSLQSLPELPLSLETLKANYCKSLKTALLFPSTAVEQLNENRKRVLFWNCLNLDEHSLVAIGLNAQINMMKFAHLHLSSPNHVDNQAIYLYQGSSVPEWLENKTTKDYIIIDLSSALDSPHWGFIFCFVFGNYQGAKYMTRGLDVNLIISDEDGEGKKDSVRMSIHDVFGQIESNQVCVMYDQRCSSILNSRAKNQMRFKIQLTFCKRWTAKTSRLQQEVLKGFGVSPISTITYGNFIQHMELRDRDSMYQID